MVTKIKIGLITTVSESAANTSADNEADTNADMRCLGQNFIPLSYISYLLQTDQILN